MKTVVILALISTFPIVAQAQMYGHQGGDTSIYNTRAGNSIYSNSNSNGIAYGTSGETYRSIGNNTMQDSNGVTWRSNGGAVYGSNGTVCTRTGNILTCN